ncbi:MAG: NAD-dependent epimerase/dehydratase family protein, partial [Thaumarchaeota archaeon]|nr:NAD-dependent epimerase/dehydratase family protein [Nitrososphaerota archaeon]
MILVTGATGFIGTRLVQSLVKNGYKVKCFARRSSNITFLEKNNVEVVYGDLIDKKSIETALDNVDSVVHLAAILDSTNKKIYDVNVIGAKNLVEACKNKGIRKIIVLSSIVVTRDNLETPYQKTKSIAEKLFLTSELNCLIIRPTWVYGEGSKSFEKLVSSIKRLPFVPIIGSGDYKVQPVYVDDVVRLIILLLTSDKTKNKIYQIGGSTILTFNEMVNIIYE